MKDTNHLDLFERYARQQMSPTERGDLEKRLHTDPDFAAEWQFYQLAVQAAQEDARARADSAALQQQLEAEGFFEETHRAIREEMAEEKAAKSTPADVPLRVSWLSPALRRWAVAAGLAALATGMWLLNEGRREREIAAVIEEHLHYNFGQTDIQYGMADPTDTLLLAGQKFNEGKFDETIALLQSQPKPWSDEAKYLLARAWFKKENYNSCLAQIEDLLRGGERVFLEIRWQAQLLQAEAFIGTGDREQAKALLDAYLKADANNPNKQELLRLARELRQDL